MEDIDVDVAAATTRNKNKEQEVSHTRSFYIRPKFLLLRSIFLQRERRLKDLLLYNQVRLQEDLKVHQKKEKSMTIEEKIVILNT